MWAFLASLSACAAFAAGTTPDDRVEIWADAGVATGQAALAFGIGAGMREGPLTLLGTAGFGGRANLFQTGVSERPGFGLATLAGALALDKRSAISAVLLLDAALLDTAERACGAPADGACRHRLFVGMERNPTLGISLQPAAGARISGVGASGSAFSATFAIQPHWLRENHLWFAPRLDIAALEGSWSAHAWAGRYGLAIGIGHRLSRPGRRERQQ